MVQKKSSQNRHYRLKKKWHGPLSHWCRKGKTALSGPTSKKTFFVCVFPKASRKKPPLEP